MTCRAIYCQGLHQKRVIIKFPLGCAFQSMEGIEGIIQFQVINTDWQI